MSRLLVLLSLVLVPQLASAQSITLRRDADATTSTWTFGGSRCADSITMRWTYTPTGLGLCASPLTLWSTTNACGDAAGVDDENYTDVEWTTLQTTLTGTFEVPIAKLPLFTTGTLSDGGTTGVTCGVTSTEKKVRICGGFKVTNATTGCVATQASSLTLVYDTQPPVAPSISGVAAEDSAASMTFTADEDTIVMIAEVQGPDAADFTYSTEVAATSSFIRVKNLVNGQVWKVRLRGQDAAGNTSEPSEAKEVIPVETVGGWGLYVQQGGTEGAGCSAAGAAVVPLAALGLALARALARRSRRS